MTSVYSVYSLIPLEKYIHMYICKRIKAKVVNSVTR